MHFAARFRLLAILLAASTLLPAQDRSGSNDRNNPYPSQQPSAAPNAEEGEGRLDTSAPKGIAVDEIIRRFAAKEEEFKQARDHYTYRQDVKVQTLDGDTPTGEYREVVDVMFKDNGKRLENVVFAPQSTLREVSMDREDYEDIRHRYPFVLTTEELPLYQVLYVGKQRVDEISTYVFDIAPVKLEKDQRYFQGRIWVDDQDFQIVKSHGKPVYQLVKQLEGHLFPSYTSYREQIDGKYWFPTYARADEMLHFRTNDVHIRIVVKYSDYKRFESKSRITYGGEAPPEEPKAPEPKK